jgi:cytosine/adenosine deaminase-related metal-dependent hydrolase
MLLKGGTVLVHDEEDHVHSLKADLLIEGKIISKIEPNISVSASTQIIDCTNKILTPGFIDTHHHVWQTLLKGRHGDDMLLDYFPKGIHLCLPCENTADSETRKLHLFNPQRR